MTIEQISKFTVKIMLSKNELSSYNMNFGMLDSDNYETRNMLVSLLEYIQENVDLDLSSDKLFVEAFASGDGGCLLYISVIDNTAEKLQRPAKPAVMTILTEFTDFNALTDFSRKFAGNINRMIINSQLYFKDNLFRLVIEANYSNGEKIIRLLREYGTVIGTGEFLYSSTKEYFQCIEIYDALKKLSKLS